MVKIRLRRMGAKKEPYYRIVVADSRFPRDGRCIEEIGTYDPKNEANAITIDADKAKQWIKNGDMGKLIGRQGRIAKEIRTIIKSVAQRTGQKVSVEIVD